MWRKRGGDNIDDNIMLMTNGKEEEKLVDRYEHKIELELRWRRRRFLCCTSQKNEKSLSDTQAGLGFREDILEYALSKMRNIVQDRWGKMKLSFKCGIRRKCKGKVYCSYEKLKQCWLVKTWYKFNSCTSNGKCNLLKNLVIASFLDKLRENSCLIPARVQEQIKDI